MTVSCETLREQLETIAELVAEGLAVDQEHHKHFPNKLRVVLGQIERAANVPEWPI